MPGPILSQRLYDLAHSAPQQAFLVYEMLADTDPGEQRTTAAVYGLSILRDLLEELERETEAAEGREIAARRGAEGNA